MKCSALIIEPSVVSLRDESACECGETASAPRVVDVSRGGVFAGTW